MKLPKNLPKRQFNTGTPVFRIFKESLDADGKREYESNDFNDYNYVINNNGLLNTKEGKCAFLKQIVHRFSPTIDGKGIVPAIYLAETEKLAIGETILRGHDNPKPKPIVMQDLYDKYLVNLFVNTNLVLCDLTKPFLKGGSLEVFDFTEEESTHSKHSSKAYKKCHQIANAIYNHKDKVDGLYWESRHLPNTFNVVLWNRKRDVSPLIFNPVQAAVKETALFEDEGKYRIMLEAERLSIPAAYLK